MYKKLRSCQIKFDMLVMKNVIGTRIHKMMKKTTNPSETKKDLKISKLSQNVEKILGTDQFLILKINFQFLVWEHTSMLDETE